MREDSALQQAQLQAALRAAQPAQQPPRQGTGNKVADTALQLFQGLGGVEGIFKLVDRF
jgi:hypothetical protein